MKRYAGWSLLIVGILLAFILFHKATHPKPQPISQAFIEEKKQFIEQAIKEQK